VPIDHDRRRLGAYYVIDWILESRGEPFSPGDLFRAEGRSGLDPLLRVSRPGVSRLLEHLTDKDLLKKVRKAGPTATLIGNAEQSQQDVYVLSARVRRLLVEFAESSEAERASLNLVGSAAEPGVPGDLGLVAGRYRLLEVIGRGGHGTVYLGRDDLLDREVAVKTLARFEPHDDLARNRLQREARIAGRLSHPNVVRTYDVVTLPDGGVAIVMERLTGASLASVVDDAGALPAAQVARIGVTLAKVLQYLSEQHIARIDLKPSNVVMEPKRGPVIIDFGFAKEMNTTITFTDDQVMVGTPMYMSPEQMGSGLVDSRADIYSLGLVLIFCVTGQAPRAEETIAAVLHGQLNDDIDTSAVPVSDDSEPCSPGRPGSHPTTATRVQQNGRGSGQDS
jgi:eukaryotic-like serine/threonine-protein kinase